MAALAFASVARADETRLCAGTVALPAKIDGDRRRVFVTDGKTILAETRDLAGGHWELRVPPAARWIVAELLPPTLRFAGVPWIGAAVAAAGNAALALPDFVTLEIGADETARSPKDAHVGLYLNAVTLAGVPPSVVALLKKDMNDDLALAFISVDSGQARTLHVQRGRYTICGGRMLTHDTWEGLSSLECARVTDVDSGEVFPCVGLSRSATFDVNRSRRLRVSFSPPR